MPSPDSLYKEILSSNESFKNSIVEKHINKYKEIDKIYPSNQSFFMIINTAKLKYEFVSTNFKHIVGYNTEIIKKQGPNFFMSLFHPDDLKLWLHEIKDFMEMTINDFKLEDRKKLLYSYNFRLKNIKNDYINIIAHLTPIEFDTSGKPFMAISHYTLTSEEKENPMIGSIKIMNKNNVYETVFYKNYSQENITNILTKREIDIIQELALEKSSKEIGERLFISSHTVDQHRRNIINKLKFKSTDELIQHCKSNNYF